MIGRVVQIEALEDGRYGLVVVGTWRFRVRSWLPDDPYPLADIDAWPDDDPDDPHIPDLIAGARDRIRDIHRRVAELGVERDPGPRLTVLDAVMPPIPRSATIRCSPPTISPASRRSVRPTATGCSVPTRRGGASSCSTKRSTTSSP